ncbi:MAG: valine--tRNA ligase [Egibacteraceae bacterium]
MLSKTYEPAEVEPQLYAWWESSDFFHTEPGDSGEPFCIVIPLPNVTGSLHLGHALNHTLQDALIRHARMCGRNTMWQPGMDHAGIATQNVVERQIAAEGLTRHDLGREAFVERVWTWKEQSGGLILGQMRRLGVGPDWDRAAFTLDEQRSRAVREAFVSLYEDGLIYRGRRLINWCPRCITALSDIEVEHADEAGELTFIRYPEMDGKGPGVVVATTRPETMLGDTAVAVHPGDQRYRHLVGRSVRLPLLDREIPVIADDHVDPEFGTGAVKVTPAHDPNDYEIGQRHELPAIDVMNDDASINENGGPYEGLSNLDARQRVVADLSKLGLIEKIEPHVRPVGHCSRCRTIVEPRISDQWFVKVGPLASEAIDAVRSGRTRFVPERNEKSFLDWLENLHDWCISRQIWWGHRIPAWYDEDGGVHVLREDPPPDSGLRQEPDVLDTWFSSALWPFSTQGWPDDTPALRAWYPGTVLVTGYDINTFWVSRMMMMGLRFMKDVPFEAVLNHGLVRDQHGKKMSKSFGNVIDPLELMDAYGADALRFALIRASAPGQDVPLAQEWVEGARRFMNKLWNAARLVLMRIGDIMPADGLPGREALRLEDRWILSRLDAVTRIVDDAFTSYDLSQAARALYHFVWDEYCDWYLELAKLRDDEACARVLSSVLDTVLRLLHPIAPFVTEEIWRQLNRVAEDADRTIMRAAWPTPAGDARDEAAEARFDALREAVSALRRFRSDHGLAPVARFRVVAVAGQREREVLEAGLEGIERLAGVGSWSFSAVSPSQGPVGKVVLDGAELFIPLGGLIDLDGERSRLRKEHDRAVAERDRAAGKLSNRGFVEKAPEQVVDATRAKLADWETMVAKLEAQLQEMGA